MEIKEFNWKQEELAKMKPLESYEYAVVHHTESEDVPATEIDRWHKGRGWVGIGYHYLIRADGSIERGRPANKQGAHALGHNHLSVGIALTGNFMNSVPTPAQMDSLEDLLNVIRKAHPGIKVVGHRDLTPTACPGTMFPWDELMWRLEGKPQDPDAVTVVVMPGEEEINGRLIDGTAWVPVRALAELLGRRVHWNAETKTVFVE